MNSLNKLLVEAIDLMQKTGFPIKRSVKIRWDQDLPFMGYTTEEGKASLIVVSGMAIVSGGIKGLLIHELGHVYRTETLHPSHNYSLWQEVLNNVTPADNLKEYQNEIIHSIINHIQDIYADDISFRVFEKYPEETFLPESANRFFLGWVGNPLSGYTGRRDRWTSVSALLSTAFAQANLERHNIKDTDDLVRRAVKIFLENNPRKISNRYKYFEQFMVKIPEAITSEDFEGVTSLYLREFINLIEN